MAVKGNAATRDPSNLKLCLELDVQLLISLQVTKMINNSFQVRGEAGDVG